MAACGIAPEDDDGNAASKTKPVAYIDEDKVATIAALAEEVGADMPKLLAFFKASSLDKIQMIQYPQVIAALEKKRTA
jgi:hypothetical protein